MHKVLNTLFVLVNEVVCSDGRAPPSPPPGRAEGRPGFVFQMQIRADRNVCIITFPT